MYIFHHTLIYGLYEYLITLFQELANMVTTYNQTAPIGKLFFQQAGAHVLAGLFAFVAIFITGHHVSTFLFDISINIPICKSWKI